MNKEDGILLRLCGYTLGFIGAAWLGLFVTSLWFALPLVLVMIGLMIQGYCIGRKF